MMLVETEGKAGRLCEPARNGELKCPLIVRPTSEDVITGNLFGMLELISPRIWLPGILNRSLGHQHFHKQIFRNFRIQLWKNYPGYPSELLPWREGSTQVDAVIEWENPPTTIFIEVKYLAGVSRKTSRDDGSSGYPSDQIIRNLRVGLLECGWIREDRLFDRPKRNFVFLLLTPKTAKHELLEQYRDPGILKAAIPCPHRITDLPNAPFVGQLSFNDIHDYFLEVKRHCSKFENRAIDRISAYLKFKSQLPNFTPAREISNSTTSN